MKKLKIAIMVNAFPVLSETFILNQVTGLIDLGHDVQVFADSDPGQKNIHPDFHNYNLKGRTVYGSDMIPENKFIRFFAAIGLICRNILMCPVLIIKALNIFAYAKNAINFEYLFYAMYLQNKDIIHCHYGPNGNKFLFLKKLLGQKIKYVTTFHGYDISRELKNDRFLYSSLFRTGDIFLPVSNMWKDELIKAGCPANKIIVHRMGIDMKKVELQSRIGHDNGEISILTVARLVEKKGLEWSISAVAETLKKYNRIKYLIIGDGENMVSLRSLIDQLHLAGIVELAGWRDSHFVKQKMYESDIFMLTSVVAADGDMEGIPVSLIEAMGTGLPVIATVHSGIPELVKDNETGLLVPEKDINAISSKLELLVMDSQLRQRIGRAARVFVESQYDITRLNRKLVDIYNADI